MRIISLRLTNVAHICSSKFQLNAGPVQLPRTAPTFKTRNEWSTKVAEDNNTRPKKNYKLCTDGKKSSTSLGDPSLNYASTAPDEDRNLPAWSSENVHHLPLANRDIGKAMRRPIRSPLYEDEQEPHGLR